MQENIQSLKKELNKDFYKNVDKDYSELLIEYQVKQLEHYNEISYIQPKDPTIIDVELKNNILKIPKEYSSFGMDWYLGSVHVKTTISKNYQLHFNWHIHNQCQIFRLDNQASSTPLIETNSVKYWLKQEFYLIYFPVSILRSFLIHDRSHLNLNKISSSTNFWKGRYYILLWTRKLLLTVAPQT